MDWIGGIPLWPRVRDAVFFFVAGPHGRGQPARPPLARGFGVAVVFVVVVAVAAALAAAGSGRRVALVLGVAVVTVAVPLALAAVGSDFVLDRNFLAGLGPADDRGVRRACAARLRWPRCRGARAAWPLRVVVLGVVREQHLQRDDWRAVAEGIGSPTPDRVVRLSPFWQADACGSTGRSSRCGAAARDQVHARELELHPVQRADPPPAAAPVQGDQRVRIQNFKVAEFTSPEPVVVDPGALTGTGQNRAVPFALPPG